MTLSILMATYHRENPEYLRACLNSLRAQTQPANEIILVEDGPLTPALYSEIDNFSDLPLRVVKYRGDGNLGGALAYGLTHCSHRIVARMDSDDIALPNRLSDQLRVLKKGGYHLLGGDISEFDTDPENPSGKRIMKPAPTQWQVQTRNPMNHMTVMFDRDAVLEVGNYWPLSGFEDWYLWLRMSNAGKKIGNMRQVLVYARTDSRFLSRRSGRQYRRYEQHALALFRKEQLISRHAYLFTYLSRMVLRALPNKILRKIYKVFLRSR